jgi:hypothetical protein
VTSVPGSNSTSFVSLKAAFSLALFHQKEATKETWSLSSQRLKQANLAPLLFFFFFIMAPGFHFAFSCNQAC